MTALLAYPIGRLLNSVNYNFWIKRADYQRAAKLEVVMQRIEAALKSTQYSTDLRAIAPHAFTIQAGGHLIEFCWADQSRLQLSVDHKTEELLSTVSAFELTYYNEQGEPVTAPEQCATVKIKITLGTLGSPAELTRQRVVNLWLVK